MANFSPAEILSRLTWLKFCCDYMTNFTPALNISLRAKYKNAAGRKVSGNQNSAENRNCEERRFASLAVWPFGGAQISTFWDGNSLEDNGTEAKPVFSQQKGRTCIERKENFKLAEFMASLTAC